MQNLPDYEDSQKHALKCDEHIVSLSQEYTTYYLDLFGNFNEQAHIRKAFQLILHAREKLQDTPRGLLGHFSGPHDL